MNITSACKTKWFRQGVYEVDGFVMVHSGRAGAQHRLSNHQETRTQNAVNR